MDPNSAMATENKNKKKRASSEEAQEVEDDFKRSCHSSSPLPTGVGDEFLGLVKARIKQAVDLLFPQISDHTIVKNTIEEVVNRMPPEPLDTMIQKCIKEIVNRPEISAEMEHFCRQKIFKEIDQRALIQLKPFIQWKQEEGSGSRTPKFKLMLCNEIAPRMYAKDEIRAANDEPLKVAICHHLNNTIISDWSLFLPATFFLLDGELKEITKPRKGKPSPLIYCNYPQLYIENGVGSISGLHVTDNSSWTVSKEFCLGIKVTDEKFLDEHGMIEQLVSQPFKVLDDRMKGSEKRHPPKWRDEVWRLEGIRKDGSYHKILTKKGILTVGDLWEACHKQEQDLITLKQDLGLSKSDKKWNKIYSHLLECCDIPTFHDKTNQIQVNINNQNPEVYWQNQNPVSDVQTNYINQNSEVYQQNQNTEVNYQLVQSDVQINYNTQNSEVNQQNQNPVANDQLVQSNVQSNYNNQNSEVNHQNQNHEVNDQLVESDVQTNFNNQNSVSEQNQNPKAIAAGIENESDEDWLSLLDLEYLRSVLC